MAQDGQNLVIVATQPLFKEGNAGSLWDESHPIMAGIDNTFEYNYIVTSYLEQNDPSNFNVESVMNLVSDTTNYEYSHAILVNQLVKDMWWF